MRDVKMGGGTVPAQSRVLRNRMLNDLATALDIPMDAFFASPEDGDRVAGTAELLRLWATLDRAEQRREVMDCLRRMTDAVPPD